VSCLIEIWTMVGEQRTLYTPACLNCGWIGSDGTMPEAEAEGAMHERGERRPWQMAPGQEPGWEASRDRVEREYGAVKTPSPAPPG
jgi:hypothetical protein